jgi:hypothetical protein
MVAVRKYGTEVETFEPIPGPDVTSGDDKLLFYVQHPLFSLNCSSAYLNSRDSCVKCFFY